MFDIAHTFFVGVFNTVERTLLRYCIIKIFHIFHGFLYHCNGSPDFYLFRPLGFLQATFLTIESSLPKEKFWGNI